MLLLDRIIDKVADIGALTSKLTRQITVSEVAFHIDTEGV